jgi:fructose/tagatose bisphosphate aldolase
MADRRLILKRDEGVPHPNKLDQEITSAIIRALFHQQAPAHIRIMNTRRKQKGAITAITHQNITVEVAMKYHDIIITAARPIDKGVLDFKESKRRE